MGQSGHVSRAVAAALEGDPAYDADWPPETTAQAIRSGEVNLNAVLFTASGSGPHPTVLLLHGLPGNEQNLDCAQAIRRAGWNVLTVHYRGSWGGPGTFSFVNCLEDAASALRWLQSRTPPGNPRVDPTRIVLIGHSMGGFVAAHTAAANPDVLATSLISGVDLGSAFGKGSSTDTAVVDENVGFSAGLHILAGTSPEALVNEARRHADEWSLTSYAPRIAGRPLLVITSEDGFSDGSNAMADAVTECSGSILTRAHLLTDHSYSGCRISLQRMLLEWLLSTRELTG